MRYTARKILTLLVTMLVVSLLTFAAFDMISGDPAATLLGTQATPEKVEALRTEMGLNRPMLVRYGEWLAGFFTGNLGVSFQYRQPVQALLGPKMLVTLCLSLVSFVLIVVVSLPLGLLSANGKLEVFRVSLPTVSRLPWLRWTPAARRSRARTRAFSSRMLKGLVR